ncbi:MAG: zinc ribbon domain-containing protein [Ruminococcus sp.]|nr:zinc ribbon domain-containing protein [Ruminococcus sp.]
MFCQKCGAKVEEGKAVCPNCGCAVNGKPAGGQGGGKKGNSTARSAAAVSALFLLIAVITGLGYAVENNRAQAAYDAANSAYNSSKSELDMSEKYVRRFDLDNALKYSDRAVGSAEKAVRYKGEAYEHEQNANTCKYACIVSVILMVIALLVKNNEDKKAAVPSGYTSSSNAGMLSRAAGEQAPVIKSAGGKWICPDCGESNPTSTRVCRGCGKDK